MVMEKLFNISEQRVEDLENCFKYNNSRFCSQHLLHLDLTATGGAPGAVKFKWKRFCETLARMLI